MTRIAYCRLVNSGTHTLIKEILADVGNWTGRPGLHFSRILLRSLGGPDNANPWLTLDDEDGGSMDINVSPFMACMLLQIPMRDTSKDGRQFFSPPPSDFYPLTKGEVVISKHPFRIEEIIESCSPPLPGGPPYADYTEGAWVIVRG